MPAEGRAARPIPLRGAGDAVRGLVTAGELFADAASSGSTEVRNSSEGRPPHFAFHIHLWPMAQMLRGRSAGGDAAERGDDHVAIFECGDEVAPLSGLCRSQCRSLEKPHSEE